MLKPLALVALTLSLAACDDSVRGTAHVIDGDTIHLTGGMSFAKVRLSGIDAPELRQTCKREGFVWWCGLSAKSSLAYVAEGRQVRCSISGSDRYKRLLGVCHTDEGVHLNDYMVRVGLAISAYGNWYSSAESTARLEQRGLWSSEFIPPSEWRRQHD